MPPDRRQAAEASRVAALGAAADPHGPLVDAQVEPDVPGSIYLSRHFVPVGELVRVNISVLTSLPAGERFADFFWAMSGLAIRVRYTDANGGQPLVTRAQIQQAATQGPWVSEIAVFHDGDESKPIATGRASY